MIARIHINDVCRNHAACCAVCAGSGYLPARLDVWGLRRADPCPSCLTTGRDCGGLASERPGYQGGLAL